MEEIKIQEGEAEAIDGKPEGLQGSGLSREICVPQGAESSQETVQPSGYEEFKKLWAKLIECSINAARTHLHLQKARIEDPSRLSALVPITPVKRRGSALSAKFSGHHEAVIMASFPPKTPVKIICRDPSKTAEEIDEENKESERQLDDDDDFFIRTSHRNFRRSVYERRRGARSKKKEASKNRKYAGKEVTIAKAVVKEVSCGSDGITEIAFELLEKADIRPGWDMEIQRAENTRALGKELVLIGDFVSTDKDAQKTPCMEAFIKGEFFVDRDVRRERKDTLDESQNQIYGLSLEEAKGKDIEKSGEAEKTEEAELANKVLFLHGPPGSGKTTTLCEIACEHARRGRKVLVLSHSNEAAINVPALKISGMGKTEKSLIHIAGNVAEKTDSRLHKFRMKRKLRFPTKQLEELKRMSDKDFIDKYFHDEVERIHEEALSRAKEEMRRLGGYPSMSDEDIATRSNWYQCFFTSGLESLFWPDGIVAAKKNIREGFLVNYEKELEGEMRKFERSMEKGGIVFSTLGTLARDKFLAGMLFDVVIVDENTRLRMPDLILALSKAGKQILFVGDPLQLGNIPLDPKERCNLESALEKEAVCPAKTLTATQVTDDVRAQIFDLYSKGEATEACDIYEEGPAAAPILRIKDREKHLPYVFLNKDRRSLPSIVKLLSELIYDGKLEPGREAREGEHQGTIQWIDTKNLESGERMAGTSRRNPAEAELVARKVLQRIKTGASPQDVAVIATYRQQAELIKKKLSRMLNHGVDKKTGKPSEKDLANRALFEILAPNIDSVDAFQGSERKIVFVSLTRSNEAGHIGFLNEERRIGVAIGRAQDELYIVGDSKTVVERNENPESQAFFEKMYGLVGEYGKVEERRKS